MKNSRRWLTVGGAVLAVVLVSVVFYVELYPTTQSGAPSQPPQYPLCVNVPVYLGPQIPGPDIFVYLYGSQTPNQIGLLVYAQAQSVPGYISYQGNIAQMNVAVFVTTFSATSNSQLLLPPTSLGQPISGLQCYQLTARGLNQGNLVF